MIVSVLSEETCSSLSQRQVLGGNKNLVGKQSVCESCFFFFMIALELSLQIRLTCISVLKGRQGEENIYLLVNVLEEAMATHSSIFAWKIPWRVEPGGLQSMGCKELDVAE